MSLYETWPAPGRRRRRLNDVDEEFKFLTNTAVADWPWPAQKRRQEWWVGEIKPHTARGIAAGRAQLRRRPNEPPPMSHRLLVTYRPSGISMVEVLASPGDRGFTTWHRVGATPFDWKQRVPLESCPACLGAAIEKVVRGLVKNDVASIVTKRSAYSRGWDLSTRELEELEFLRELVMELGAG